MDYEEFKILHSEVIMCCQCLENDIKWIYSYMKKGNPFQNFDDLEKKTFGQIVRELRKLDYSDDKPYISKSDYDFLENLVEKRNYWCHQCYVDFLYIDGYLHSKEYKDVCNKLEDEHAQFMRVSEAVEDIKIEVIKKYGRD